MKFLADVNIPLPLINLLNTTGHQVQEARVDYPLAKDIQLIKAANVAHRPFLLFATLFGESRFPPPLRELIPLVRETLSKSDQVVNYRSSGLEGTRLTEDWATYGRSGIEFEHCQFEHRFGEFSGSVVFARTFPQELPRLAEGRITLKRDRRSITPDNAGSTYAFYEPYFRVSFDNDQQLSIWVNKQDISTVRNLTSPSEHPLIDWYSSERVDPSSGKARWVPDLNQESFQLVAPLHQIGACTTAFVEQTIQEAIAQFLGERNDQLNNLSTEGPVIEIQVVE